MLYHAGPSSLVFFAECLKIITDSDLQIQNYKIEVQLKPKLHQLWRQFESFDQSAQFLPVVIVFILFCYCHSVFKSRATCRPKSRCQSDLSTVHVLANRSLHQDLMHTMPGTVERRSQMFVYRPFRFSLSPPRSTKGLFTGYLDLGITNLLFAINTHVYSLYSFAYPIDYSYSVLSFCS